MTSLSLGPAVDSRLEDIGDALEGRKVLEEPYVDKKTILRALKEQNQVIRMMQMAFFKSAERMEQIEETFRAQTETIGQLKGKVEFFERSLEKIEEMESVAENFKEKMVTFDETISNVAKQGEFVATMSNQLKTQTEQFSTFKADISSTVESAKSDLTVLQTTAEKLETTTKEMGSTIEISSSQIKHEDPQGESILLDIFVNKQSTTLSTVESQTEDAKAFIAESSGVMEKLDSDTVENLKMMSGDFKDLMEWKEEQAGIDLIDIRRSQDSIKEAIDTVQRDLFEKVAREEVESKLESKFESIIDHLQSALNSTESDEADFKAVTSNLNQICESLKNDKADKTEIAALRKQFMQHQSAMIMDSSNVDLSGNGPESMDPEDMAEFLKDFMTAHQIHHELHKKADKVVEENVGALGEDVAKIRETLGAVVQQQRNIESQLAGHANQMEGLKKKDVSSGNDNNVAGSEWKGLASAMRMDATGVASNNNGAAVDSGSFPINERLQMPREASNNLSATMRENAAQAANSPGAANTESGNASTPLPAVAQPAAAAYTLTSPLKQPQLMMQHGQQQEQQQRDLTPLPNINQQPQTNQPPGFILGGGSGGGGGGGGGGGTAQMMATSKMTHNPVVQNVAAQPGTHKVEGGMLRSIHSKTCDSGLTFRCFLFIFFFFFQHAPLSSPLRIVHRSS